MSFLHETGALTVLLTECGIRLNETDLRSMISKAEKRNDHAHPDGQPSTLLLLAVNMDLLGSALKQTSFTEQTIKTTSWLLQEVVTDDVMKAAAKEKKAREKRFGKPSGAALAPDNWRRVDPPPASSTNASKSSTGGKGKKGPKRAWGEKRSQIQ